MVLLVYGLCWFGDLLFVLLFILLRFIMFGYYTVYVVGFNCLYLLFDCFGGFGGLFVFVCVLVCWFVGLVVVLFWWVLIVCYVGLGCWFGLLICYLLVWFSGFDGLCLLVGFCCLLWCGVLEFVLFLLFCVGCCVDCMLIAF